jgi:hypothetical protein
MKGERKVERVMKDKDLKLDEMKVSHTLGGVWECLVWGRGKSRGVDANLIGKVRVKVILR